MSKYYNKVGTPQTGATQAQTPSGPVRDTEAHQDLSESLGGLGGAIQDLVGIADQGFKLSEKMSEMARLQMEEKSGLSADDDSVGIGESAEAKLDAYAIENDIDVSEMTGDDIRGITPNIITDYIKDKGLSNKEYLPILKSRLEDRMEKYAAIKHVKNKKKRTDANYEKFSRGIEIEFLNSDSDNMKPFIDSFEERMDTYVGEGKAIEDSRENAQIRGLKDVIGKMVAGRYENGIKKLKSPQMMKYFKDVEGYTDIIDITVRQNVSVVNGRRQDSLGQVKEGVYTTIDTGGFKTQKEAFDAIDKHVASLREEDKPDKEDIVKLKAQAFKEQAKEIDYQKYEVALNNNDFTVLQRSPLSAKETEHVLNKHMKNALGMDPTQEMSPDNIELHTNSGSWDKTLPQMADKAVPWGSWMVDYLNVQATGGPEEVRQKNKTVSSLLALTEGRANPLKQVMQATAYGAHLQVEGLLARLDAGVIDTKEFDEAYTRFGNDLKRNMSPFFVYTSPTALATQAEDHSEWLDVRGGDANWTNDKYLNPMYVRNEHENNYNILVDSGNYTDEQARKGAVDMFRGTHHTFENPDGSEGVLPYKFKRLDVDDIFTLATRVPEIATKIEAHTLLDNDFDGKGALSIRPVKNATEVKLMQFYYLGVPTGPKFSYDQLKNGSNALEKRRLDKVSKEHAKKLEELRNN